MKSLTDKALFKSLIEEKTRNFVGREFLFDAIGDFIQDHTAGYFVIQSEPGVGKTAFLAEFVKRTGCLAHFNMRSEGIHQPPQFIDNICSQLRARFGLANEVPETTSAGLSERLQNSLDASRRKLDQAKRLLIAVDAIDEVESTGQHHGSNVLHLPANLPENVYFILTCRTMDIRQLPLNVKCSMELFNFSGYPQESEADIRAFLRNTAERPRIQSWLSEQKLTVDDFVDWFTSRSELNFMYLCSVLRDIEEGNYRGLPSDHLPYGLQGYYEDQWRRMGMMTDPLPRKKIRILYVLSEIREPISRSLIMQFAGEEDLDVMAVQCILDEWRPFLAVHEIDGERRYSLFHRTFRDFLHRKDILKAAGVTIDNVSSAIVDKLWRELMGDE